MVAAGDITLRGAVMDEKLIPTRMSVVSNQVEGSAPLHFPFTHQTLPLPLRCSQHLTASTAPVEHILSSSLHRKRLNFRALQYGAP